MKVATYTTPPSTLILTVDKLSSELFGLDEDELNVMLKDRNKSHKFMESEPRYEEKVPKKTNEVTTKFHLQYHDCLENAFNLTFFDQIILSASMTEFLQKNTIITPNIIYRDLGGCKLHDLQLMKQIQHSFRKLSNLEMLLNAKDASKFLFQVKGTAFDDIRRGFVLPAEPVTVKLNGQQCQAYQITQLSLVFEYARCKGHVIQIPIKHLIVRHTKNTLTFLLLKIYLYTRMLRIQRKLANSKKKKQDAEPQSIRLDTMYQVCGFVESIKQWKFRMDLLKQLIRFMDHLIQLKVISSYQLVDENKVTHKHLKDCTKLLITFP